MTAVTATGGSVGTTSRAALTVSYNDAGAAAGLPQKVFIKCTSTLAQRLMLGLGGFIECEAGFYADVRPRLEIEAPHGYFAAVDARSWRSILLLEDVLSTRGARFLGPQAKVSPQQLADLLSSVATWHRALWNHRDLMRWRWLRSTAEQMRTIDALIGMADRRGVGGRRSRNLTPASLRRRRHDLYAGMRRSMQLQAHAAQTYLHGDLHVANTYLTAAGTLGVCDWQVGLKGCWAHDVAYLLITALEIDERRSSESELLDHYRDRLSQAGGPRITREEAFLAYRRATFYPHFAWTYTLGRSRLQPSFQPQEVCLMMIERISAAIVDLNSLEAVGL